MKHDKGNEEDIGWLGERIAQWASRRLLQGVPSSAAYVSLAFLSVAHYASLGKLVDAAIAALAYGVLAIVRHH